MADAAEEEPEAIEIFLISPDGIDSTSQPGHTNIPPTAPHGIDCPPFSGIVCLTGSAGESRYNRYGRYGHQGRACTVSVGVWVAC
jgi:hypothetical protein